MTSTTASFLAAYYPHDQEPPDDTADGVDRWYAPATNVVVETLKGAPGGRVRTQGNPDEHCVVLDGLSAAVKVSTPAQTITGEEPGVLVVPPGDSELEFLTAGYAYRVFTSASAVHSWARTLARHPLGSGDVRPLAPAPPPPQGYALRRYLVRDYPEGGHKRVFRSADIMIAMILPQAAPRDPARLTPHVHEDFEQACLVVEGTYVHHVRRQWGRDSTLWRDDEHRLVAAPSVTVFSPPDIHTSQTVGDGPFAHVDVFCPPRSDFIEAGQVLNAGDYPVSGGLGR